MSSKAPDLHKWTSSGRTHALSARLAIVPMMIVSCLILGSSSWVGASGLAGQDANGSQLWSLFDGLVAGQVVSDGQGRARVTAPAFDLYLDRSAPRANLVEAVESLVGMAFHAQVMRLEIVDGRLRMHGSTSQPRLLSGVNATIDAQSSGRIVGEGTFQSSDGPGVFSVDLARDDEAALSGRVMIEGPRLSLSFTGTIRRPNPTVTDATGVTAEGDLVLASTNLAGTLSTFGLLEQLPGPTLPVRLAGTAQIAGGVISVQDGEVIVGALESQGFTSLDLSKTPAKLDATLAFDRIGLEQLDLLGASEWLLPTTKPATPVRDRLLASALSWLRQLNLDARLSANSVVFGPLQTGPTAITLVAREGKLYADVAEMEVAEGSLTAQLELGLLASDMPQPPEASPAGPRPDDEPRLAVPLSDSTSLAVPDPNELDLLQARMTASANGIAFGELLGHFFGKPIVSGVGNAQLMLSARGRTLDELLTNLEGDATLRLAENAAVGLDLDALAEAVSVESVTGLPEDARRAVSFDQLDARVVVRHGTLFSEHVVLSDGARTVTADGTINLADAQVYLRFDRGLAASDAAPRPAVVVRGPFSSPVVHLEAVAAPPPSLETSEPLSSTQQ